MINMYFYYLILIIVIAFDSLMVYQMYLEWKTFISPPRIYMGKASVIVPTKEDKEVAYRSIESLVKQDYEDYELIVVVDREDANYYSFPDNVKVIVSDYNCEKCSGKIKAILSGLKRANGNIIVFADSDSIYPNRWLSSLIGALDEKRVATTFSWPLLLNHSIQSLIKAGFWTLGFEAQTTKGKFLWGGSMAFHRKFFTEDVERILRENICDDCTLTKIVKARGMEISFVRELPLFLIKEGSLDWFIRQVLTVKSQSILTILILIGLTSFFLISLLCFLLTINTLFLTPFFFWTVKNLWRSRKYLPKSILPSVFSTISIFFAFTVLLVYGRRKCYVWKGRKYCFS
jgi:glycosyltransferase involved in cell wall biosynthesis